MVVAVHGRDVPAPPHPEGRELLTSTVTAWTAFWRSSLTGLVEDADLPALGRLFRLYDLRGRMETALLEQPFSLGSTGQVVVNPAAKEIASLDGRIGKLEAAFGITPKARLELGVTFGAAARSLEDLNRGFDPEAGDEGDDPRRPA